MTPANGSCSGRWIILSAAVGSGHNRVAAHFAQGIGAMAAGPARSTSPSYLR